MDKPIERYGQAPDQVMRRRSWSGRPERSQAVPWERQEESGWGVWMQEGRKRREKLGGGCAAARAIPSPPRPARAPAPIAGHPGRPGRPRRSGAGPPSPGGGAPRAGGSGGAVRPERGRGRGEGIGGRGPVEKLRSRGSKKPFSPKVSWFDHTSANARLPIRTDKLNAGRPD